MSALWSAHDVARAVGAPPPASAWSAAGVTFDSRMVRPGDLFVALKTEANDGHRYVADAFARGAVAAVVSQDPAQAAGPLVRVADTLKALEALGVAGRARSRAKVASLTGSVGKTSTKEGLRVALEACGSVSASAASYNNHIGVPVSLARLPENVDYGVFEVGTNHPGEIEPLARMTRADVAAITTVEAVHLENFGSEAAIADEKAQIAAGMRGGPIVLNRDNRWFDRLAELTLARGAGRIVAVGRDPRAEVRLLDCRLDAEGSEVDADVRGRRMTWRVGTPGEHWALNSLTVVAVAAELGADVERAAAALAAVAAPGGRGRQVRVKLQGGGDFLLIDDSYNASPPSIRAMLAVLKRASPGPGGRRIVVLGDMLELGPQADEIHAALAADVANGGADLVFTCGRHMARLSDALPAALRARHEADSAALAHAVASALRAGDVLAIKGSLGSKMKRVVDAVEAATKTDGAAT